MKRTLTFLLAAAICFSMIGCGNTEKPAENKPSAQASDSSTEQKADSPQPTGTADEVPDKEQFINTYMVADPTTLDISLRNDAYSSTIMGNTMEGLIRTEGHTGEFTIVPAEAESWDISEDGTVWTFHLRDNLKWQDGVPVTADQYVYSLRRSAAPETGCPSSFFLQPIKNFKEVNEGKLPVEELGVRAVDDKTLEITLTAQTPAFIQMISGTVYYPQREDKIKEWGDKFGSEAEYYIGNGPFKLESWTHNNSLILTKNDTYWDAQAVKLSKVNIYVMADETTYYNAFQNGEVDYVSTSSLEWMERFKETDAVHIPVLSAKLNLMPLNHKDPLFCNANVRKAFGLVIDREDMSEMCFSGLRHPTYSLVVPSITVGETPYRDAVGEPVQEMIDELAAEGKTPRDLLIQGMEELGLGSDPSTVTVMLSLGGTTEFHKNLGEYLQQVFQNELGVVCNVEQMEWAIFSSRLDNGDYQMGFMGNTVYYNDPYDALSLFESSYDSFRTGWSNEEFDQLLIQASHEMDEQKRLEMYRRLEEIALIENFVINPLACPENQNFYKPYMRGYDSSTFGASGYKHMYTVGRPQ